MTVTLLPGDCLTLLPTLPAHSVDLVLADLPYGVTQAAWDCPIDLTRLWAEYKRVLKPRGVVVLTARQPFTSDLVQSNRAWFRFADVWDKHLPSGHLNAKKMPMRRHEDVLVFSPAKLGNFTYNPQMRVGVMRSHGQPTETACYGKQRSFPVTRTNQYYPTSLIAVPNADQAGKEHPNQKPVALFAYLIRTYSNPGDLVLDNCAGSGTTGLAAIETGRRAILMERDPAYCAIAERRIAAAQPALLQEAS